MLGESGAVDHAMQCQDGTCEQYVEVQKRQTRRENSGQQIESTRRMMKK